MSKTSLFHAVNTKISTITDRMHLRKPQSPFRMIVDERANPVVCMTKKEYREYLDSWDLELCRF